MLTFNGCDFTQKLSFNVTYQTLRANTNVNSINRNAAIWLSYHKFDFCFLWNSTMGARGDAVG
jgi:hypothetical protein